MRAVTVAVGILWVIMVVLLATFDIDYECVPRIEETRIYSLSRDSEMSGSFFLGIGGFGGEEKYYFYVERQGGMLLNERLASMVVVKEEDGEPRLRKSIGCGDLDELIVPNGTVKLRFNVES